MSLHFSNNKADKKSIIRLANKSKVLEKVIKKHKKIKKRIVIESVITERVALPLLSPLLHEKVISFKSQINKKRKKLKMPPRLTTINIIKRVILSSIIPKR